MKKVMRISTEIFTKQNVEWSTYYILGILEEILLHVKYSLCILCKCQSLHEISESYDTETVLSWSHGCKNTLTYHAALHNMHQSLTIILHNCLFLKVNVTCRPHPSPVKQQPYGNGSMCLYGKIILGKYLLYSSLSFNVI